MRHPFLSNWQIKFTSNGRNYNKIFIGKEEQLVLIHRQRDTLTANKEDHNNWQLTIKHLELTQDSFSWRGNNHLRTYCAEPSNQSVSQSLTRLTLYNASDSEQMVTCGKRQIVRYCKRRMTDPWQSRWKPGTQISVKDPRDYILCSNGVCHYRHIFRKIKTFLCSPFSPWKFRGKHIDIYEITKYISTWSPIEDISSRNESFLYFIIRINLPIYMCQSFCV